MAAGQVRERSIGRRGILAVAAARGMSGGAVNGTFSYRVVARLKGGERFAPFAVPDNKAPAGPNRGGTDTPAPPNPHALVPVREAGH